MKRLNYAFFCLTAFFLAVGVVNLNAQDITQPTGDGVSSNFTVTQGTTVMYYDNGGALCNGEGGAYDNNQNSTAVICPDVSGSTITIEFLEVDVETRSTTPCWDFLNIHDGNSTADALLFSGCGEDGFQSCSSLAGDGSDGGGVEAGPNDMNGSNDSNPINNIFTSTNANGCLTVNFTSDSSVPQGGWVAEVSASAVGGGATCDDGIQNGDETGVDCGGSSCAPCMGMATCDDGIQNGDEEGVDCGGSSCPPCEAICYDYSLTLSFDDFASETSWDIVDESDNVLYSGGGYTSADDFTTIVEDFCVEDGCYEFTIYDSFGDGICCGFGMGSYSFADGDGVVLGSGGDFGSSESVVFCTDCTPASASVSVVDYCSYGVFMVAVTVSDLNGASTLTISNDGGQPSLTNVFFPRTYYVGPFSIGDEVEICVSDTDNPLCGVCFDVESDCTGSLAPNNTPDATTFGVFPNPTTGDVNVNVGAFFGQSAKIEVYNAVGQMIEARQLNEIQTATERFDLSGRESGVYYIHLNVDGHENIVERVVLSARP